MRFRSKMKEKNNNNNNKITINSTRSGMVERFPRMFANDVRISYYKSSKLNLSALEFVAHIN